MLILSIRSRFHVDKASKTFNHKLLKRYAYNKYLMIHTFSKKNYPISSLTLALQIKKVKGVQQQIARGKCRQIEIISLSNAEIGARISRQNSSR